MKIVADENIPYVCEAFANLGEIRLLPGREIRAEPVRAADLLLVRSITRVNAELLQGSKVRFVGSATIGVDHVDLDYLKQQCIAFAYAPGSNANSVAEYVIAALLAIPLKPVAGRTLGIIGLGRIGTLVKTKAEALGLRVLANDPPLQRLGRTGLVCLEQLLAESDVITMHVPLILDGRDATRNLLNARKLGLLRSQTVVINTARGGVIDGVALLTALAKGRIGGAVVDVWEGEPAPNPDLIKAATIGTPHIAGYSVDGKAKGTEMLYEAACAFLAQSPVWKSPEQAPVEVSLQSDSSAVFEDVLATLVARAYDIKRDDAAFRATTDLPVAERAAAFDRLRATYPARLEFKHTRILVPESRKSIRKVLTALGFSVAMV